MIIEINYFLFFGIIIAILLIGMGLGLFFTRDYRKEMEKIYEKKSNEIRDTIRKETKNDWSAGWDAAYKAVGETQKAYYLWFREHGYEEEDIEAWLNNYLKKP